MPTIKSKSNKKTSQNSSASSKTTAGKANPVWRGPTVDGITSSLLSRYLVCKERFRLYAMEGLKGADKFNHRTFYGDCWHLCEEELARSGSAIVSNLKGVPAWAVPLQKHAQLVACQYREDQEQIQHWYNVCLTQFPHYIQHWQQHPDVKDRTPLLQEQIFDAPYILPSGRTVRLRGKWDAVDLIGKGKTAGIYLQENKTKGEIDEAQIKRQLAFDLQTMLYLVALKAARAAQMTMFENFQGAPIQGIRYNVIRRPLSGGKDSIRPHQAKGHTPAETMEHFYGRLAERIAEKPDYYFMRFRVEVHAADIQRFKQQFLDPVLENLCDDFEWWSTCGAIPFWYGAHSLEFPNHLNRHFRMPFGVYSPLLDGGETELDAYLDTGSTLGLQKITNLFPELT